MSVRHVEVRCELVEATVDGVLLSVYRRTTTQNAPFAHWRLVCTVTIYSSITISVLPTAPLLGAVGVACQATCQPQAEPEAQPPPPPPHLLTRTFSFHHLPNCPLLLSFLLLSFLLLWRRLLVWPSHFWRCAISISSSVIRPSAFPTHTHTSQRKIW